MRRRPAITAPNSGVRTARFRAWSASAAWAAAVLGGDRLPEAPPPAGRIAPFVRLTDFLPPVSCDRLLRDVLAARGRFAQATLRRKNAETFLNREARNALVLDKDEPVTRDVRSWFLPKLRAVLPEVLWRLRIDDLDVGRIAVEVTVHLHGDFFAAHRDKSYDSALRTFGFAAFSRLQEQEARDGFLERYQRCRRFFRSGRSGDWRRHLSAAQAQWITRRHGAVMRVCGYDPREAD